MDAPETTLFSTFKSGKSLESLEFLRFSLKLFHRLPFLGIVVHTHWPLFVYLATHTHTHTHGERERELLQRTTEEIYRRLSLSFFGKESVKEE